MRVHPYVTFHGNAREAFEFYRRVFGGELDMKTYGDQIDSGAQFPFDPPRDAVAHATLTGPFTCGGGDDFGEPSPRVSRGDLGFTVEADSVDEGRELIDALAADGGGISMPFEKAPWGDHFGMVTDRFGVAFNVVVTG